MKRKSVIIKLTFIMVLSFIIVSIGSLGISSYLGVVQAKNTIEEDTNMNKKIMIYDRSENNIIEENVLGKSFIEMFYDTKVGFWITDHLLKLKLPSKVYGTYMDSPFSKYKINTFIEDCNINIQEIEKPVSEYETFNEFFTRKLKPGMRPINYNPDMLISPCDARLQVYDIKEDTIFPIKGKEYTLTQLIDSNESLTHQFINGKCLIFRLAPQDYHRYCYIDDGVQDEVLLVNGYLHSVNPIALDTEAKVFQENERQYCTMHTKNFKDVLHIDVGAMLVGKIVQQHPLTYSCKRGDEKGYFKYGGSTVILIFKPQTIILDDDIVKYSQKGIETLVRYGTKIGKKYKYCSVIILEKLSD